MTAPAASPTRSSTTPTVALSETDRARLQAVVHRSHTSAPRRTKVDFAETLRWLVEERYP